MNLQSRKHSGVTALIEQTIDDLRVDSAYLRMQSREEANEGDAVVLREASHKITRLSKRLEHLIHARESAEVCSQKGP